MYRRIAVPLDGTKTSQTALHWAVTIARRADCPIELVTVAYPPVHGSELYGAAVVDSADVDRMMREAEQRLHGLAKEIERLGVQATATILEGSVPSTLADHLHDTASDLVVMTTHDRGRLEQLLLGSVSHTVIRHVHVPVLLVREGDDEPPLTKPATLDHMLVSLDGSPFGEQILPHAATLAEVMDAEVTLLGVVEPMLAIAAATPGLGAPPDMPHALPGPVDYGTDEERTRLQSRLLEQTAEPLRARQLTVRVDVVVDGQTAHAIVDYAKRHDVGLVAMTTHGRGALQRLVSGSVSEAVLRGTTTPMLMYRPDGASPPGNNPAA